jgi:hypothetical protein
MLLSSQYVELLLHTQDQLKEATLEQDRMLAGAVERALQKMVAGALDDILAKHGFAVVQRATLQRLNPGYAATVGGTRY